MSSNMNKFSTLWCLCLCIVLSGCDEQKYIENKTNAYNSNGLVSGGTFMYILPHTTQDLYYHSGVSNSILGITEYLLSNNHTVIHWIPQCVFQTNRQINANWTYPDLLKNPKLKNLIYFTYPWAHCDEFNNPGLHIENFRIFSKQTTKIVTDWLNINNRTLDVIIVSDPSVIMPVTAFDTPGKILSTKYNAPLIADFRTDMFALLHVNHPIYWPFNVLMQYSLGEWFWGTALYYIMEQFDYVFVQNEYSRHVILNQTNMNPDKIIKVSSNNICFDLKNNNNSSSVPFSWIDNKKYFNLVYVGRLAPEKGIKYFVDVYKKLLDSNKYFKQNVRWIVAGKGPQAKYVLELSSNSKYSENVLYLGHLPYSEIPYVLRRAHLFVMPMSIGDTYSRCMHESYHFGIPVIAPINCVAQTFIVNYSNGILFSSPNQLQYHLTNIISNQSLYDKLLRNAILTSQTIGHNTGPHILEKAVLDISHKHKLIKSVQQNNKKNNNIIFTIAICTAVVIGIYTSYCKQKLTIGIHQKPIKSIILSMCQCLHWICKKI